MKACQKKALERNIRELIQENTMLRVYDRSSQEEAGTLTVTFCSREEVRGTAHGRRFGFDGRQVSFRVPALTQKGGDLQLILA